MPRPPPLLNTLVLLWVLASGGAEASTTELALDGRHLLDHWTVQDGLPINHLRDVAVSDEGYVWMATLDGLVRFDGLAMRTFRRAQHPELPSNRFVAVESGGGGRLWLLTEEGTVLALDGEGHPGSRFTQWAPQPGSGALYEHLFTGNRATWAYGPDALARLDGDGPKAAKGLPPGARPESLLDVDNELWVGTREHGVWVLGPDLVARALEPTLRLGRVQSMVRHPDGGVFLGTSTGVILYEKGRGLTALDPPGQQGAGVCELLYSDRLWVRDFSGWWTLDADGYERLERVPTLDCRGGSRVIDGEPWRMVSHAVVRGTEPVGELGARLFEIVPGRDGGLWLATDGGGLAQVRPRLVDGVEPEMGPSAPWTLLVDRDQGLWVGDYQGVVYEVTDGGSRTASHWRQRPPTAETSVPAMMQAPDGDLWFATIGGVCVQTDDACIPIDLDGLGFTPTTSVRAMFTDGHQGVWLGASHALLHRPAESARFRSVLDPDGQPLTDVAAFAEAPDGALWAGTRGGGLLRLSEGQVDRWTRAEGLSSNTLRAVWASPEGEIWVGTEDAGLCQLSPPYSADPVCLSTAQGLYDDAIHSLLPDDQGRLWMSTNRGLTWASLGSLRAFVQGEVEGVFTVGLTERHGMLNREANGGASPAGSRDAQGRLWFPTQRGLAVVDPRLIVEPTPDPIIEEVAVDGAVVHLKHARALHLDQTARLLEVRWTAPEFSNPEQLRFRFRLVGVDKGWRGPTSLHMGSWTNLPPGDFELEVQAGLGELWSENVATLSVHRPPAFRETPAFLVVIGLSGLGLGALWALWRASVRRRREIELEAIVAQRTEELHRQAEVLVSQNLEIATKSARLEELDALRTRLIADLSHELRTPLTLVVGPLEDLAASGEVPEGAARARLDVIRRNTHRLEALVEQLLDLARLESGQLHIRVRCHGLVSFVRQVAGRFGARCEREGLDLRMELPEGECELWFDADLIDKVLSNLLVNAVKFTGEGGHIIVRVVTTPDEDGESQQVRVEVQDTGVGIPLDQQQRLFERFEQGERGDARRYGGVGIGLALARDLVLLHGGDIGVDSYPELGSRFWFHLPMGVDHLSPEDLDLGGRTNAEGEASEVLDATLPVPDDADAPLPRVLLVEDHADMRDFLVAHLRRRFLVEPASNGRQALALALAQPPDVVVSDVMMPDMDGLELCRRLRAEPTLAHVPILLASAKSAEEDRIAGLAVADDYMTKPLRMRELLARVGKLVARGHGAAERVGGGEGEPEEPPPSLLSEVDQAMVVRLEAVIAQRMAEPGFGVAQLSKALAYSRRQLLREVQRICGESPSDLLRARRMETGKALLERGAVHTVAEAAHQVGLSPAYFSRTYSAWFGHPPKQALGATRGRGPA